MARTRRFAEFFAGIGLVRLALEGCGWECAFANDLDPAKAEMYRARWPGDDTLVVGDVHQVDARALPECDLYTASFPCNDLSVAGRQVGLGGKESSAFWAVVRLLRERGDAAPRWVLLENVVGFLVTRGGRDFGEALDALAQLGYALDVFVLDARRWTPQSRPRLFVVADRESPNPRRTWALASELRTPALCRFVADRSDLPWDLWELPAPPSATARLDDIVEPLASDDPRWWSEDRVAYFMNQLSERHRAIADGWIAGDAVSRGTAFRRVRKGRSMAELRSDGIAGCLRTPRGGSGRQILFEAGCGERRVRLLTPRECARLQGVPDNYPIDVSPNQALFGFGDAVCVPAVSWLAQHRLRASP